MDAKFDVGFVMMEGATCWRDHDLDKTTSRNTS
jgi:hypothetical protein